MMDVLAGVGVETGLTDAVRMITSSFGFPMTPKQVRDALLHLDYNLSGYSNILATLHTTMKRLARTGELVNVVDEKGNELGAYAWNREFPVRRSKPVSASSPRLNIDAPDTPLALRQSPNSVAPAKRTKKPAKARNFVRK
jgi:hypothetical protein